MRSIAKSILSVAVVATALTFTGCKGKNKEPQVKGETVIEMHCFGSEYFSNKKFLRASGVGESMDRAVAMKKAMNEAKTKLAGSVETQIKATIDNYANSREMNNKEQVQERFEALSREVINQKLANLKTICEKLTQKEDKKYVSYVAIEMEAKDLIEAINERITKEETLRIDYDYEKFKETFEKEMDKLEKGK